MTNDEEAEAIRRAALSLDPKLETPKPHRPTPICHRIIASFDKDGKPEYLEHYTPGELLK